MSPNSSTYKETYHYNIHQHTETYTLINLYYIKESHQSTKRDQSKDQNEIFQPGKNYKRHIFQLKDSRRHMSFFGIKILLPKYVSIPIQKRHNNLLAYKKTFTSMSCLQNQKHLSTYKETYHRKNCIIH